MIITFSSGCTTARQRSCSNSAGRSSFVTQRLAVRVRRQRQRHEPEHEPAGAPAAREEERDDHGEREPDEHERARRERVARERELVDERPRQLEPRAVAGHDEPRAERADGRHADPDREHARERLAAALPEREPRERGQHRADVAELLGEVVAAEPPGEIVQLVRPQFRHLRRHQQVGEVELVAPAADAERVGVRQRDPQERRRRDERDRIAGAAQQQAAEEQGAFAAARQGEAATMRRAADRGPEERLEERREDARARRARRGR